MIYRVIVQPNASEEVDEIAAYIATDSPQNAVRWLDRLLDTLQTLRRFPKRCPLAPEDAYFPEEIRQLLYGNYRILYTIEGSAVRILHVRHGARRPIGEDE